MSKTTPKKGIQSGLLQSRKWGKVKEYVGRVSLMSDRDNVNRSNFLKDVNVRTCTVKIDGFFSGIKFIYYVGEKHVN